MLEMGRALEKNECMSMETPSSDEDLFHQWRQGDAGAFEELLERYRRPLFAVILRMVADRTMAEDLFQETFFRVLRNTADFDSARKFAPWLYTIAVNLCRDHLRKKTRSPVTRGEPLPEAAAHDDPEARARDHEFTQALEGALAALTPEQREVFVLREYAGLSFKEIAAADGSNLNTVLGRMHAAVKKLRAELAGFGEKEP
jgi:RNA polymerase sigma-70 factor (ECF subfamily)